MLRVFLVDDDALLRETLRETIPWAKCGCELVGEAGDGEMALPLIRDSRPDVLITDIGMPYMDGLSLSKLVRHEFPRTRIIILTRHREFEYARQAIELGVERYMLKPVTRAALIGVLEDLRARFDSEQEQQNHLARFRQEARDYDQYSRRRFFEQIATGQLTVHQIYEQAEKLDIDLRAGAYAVAFFSVVSEKRAFEDESTEAFARLRDSLTAYFLKYPEYIFFRNNLSTYSVLIKADAAHIEAAIDRSVQEIKARYEGLGADVSWHVAVSRPTKRLSMLSACCEEVTRLWAYRHILPKQHILTSDTVSFLAVNDSRALLDRLDSGRLDPAIIRNALETAAAEDIPAFVAEYIRGMGEAIGFLPFCQYLMLSVRFAATAFVRQLGISQDSYNASLSCLELIGQNIGEDDLHRCLTEFLLRAVEIRDKASRREQGGHIGEALAYIDRHFSDSALSLDQVAAHINLSPNYLSAAFSRRMGTTFSAYVTEKRMEKARELLRQRELRSGEIALAVGYSDPHYFSYIFKKTQGCTPREFRSGRADI